MTSQSSRSLCWLLFEPVSRVCSRAATPQLNGATYVNLAVPSRNPDGCVTSPPVTVKNSCRYPDSTAPELRHRAPPSLLLVADDSLRQPNIGSVHFPAQRTHFRIG